MTDYLCGKRTIAKQAEDAARLRERVGLGLAALFVVAAVGAVCLKIGDFNEETSRHGLALSSSFLEPVKHEAPCSTTSSVDLLFGVNSGKPCP